MWRDRGKSATISLSIPLCDTVLTLALNLFHATSIIFTLSLYLLSNPYHFLLTFFISNPLSVCIPLSLSLPPSLSLCGPLSLSFSFSSSFFASQLRLLTVSFTLFDFLSRSWEELLGDRYLRSMGGNVPEGFGRDEVQTDDAYY